MRNNNAKRYVVSALCAMGILANIKTFASREQAEVYAAITSELYGTEYKVRAYAPVRKHRRPRIPNNHKPTTPCGVAIAA